MLGSGPRKSKEKNQLRNISYRNFKRGEFKAKGAEEKLNKAAGEAED